jgi:hypothetical protein
MSPVNTCQWLQPIGEDVGRIQDPAGGVIIE